MQSGRKAHATKVEPVDSHEVFEGCEKVYLATAHYGGYVLEDALLESIKVDSGIPVNILINNDVEAQLSNVYILKPTVASFDRARIFRAYDRLPYAYVLELLKGDKIVLIAGLPPYDIVSASFFVLNPALPHTLSGMVQDKEVASHLEAVYGMAKKVAGIRPADSLVERMLEGLPSPDSWPTLTIKVGGKVLKSIALYAYYDADSEETMIPATAELHYRGKVILYRIPTCDWGTYIESFQNLLEIFNAPGDLRLLKNLVVASMKDYAKAILLIKTAEKYFRGDS